MHFDDRLATVLRQPVKGEVIARIQYRQLLDLLGARPDDATAATTDAAYQRLDVLGAVIPAESRARMIAEPSIRLRNPRLVLQLTENEPAVAIAAISSAQLTEDEWLVLIPAMSVRARGILRHRRAMGHKIDTLLERLGIGDRGLPASPTEQLLHQPSPAPIRSASRPDESPLDRSSGIGAIVRRIEEFRKARQAPAAMRDRSGDPRLPFEDSHADEHAASIAAFDFLTDAEGRIAWAEPFAAAMVVGKNLLLADEAAADRPWNRLAVGFRRRQPLRGEIIRFLGAPAIEGEWQVDAAPRFDSQMGRFTGYAGRMRRPAPPLAERTEDDESDRMRQILHELRTPVNAIQMSAEVIQQQLFGPTPHEYRALAATIASDTAYILAGFDEIDRLIRMESGTLEPESGQCDLVEVVAATVRQLLAHTDPRKSGYAAHYDQQSLPVGMAAVDAERLVWRLLAALAGATAPAELLGLRCLERDGMAILRIGLPGVLANSDDEALFHARAEGHSQTLSAGMFGLGFTLRLAAAEARAAGGWLKRMADAELELAIPGLTAAPAEHSHAKGDPRTG